MIELSTLLSPVSREQLITEYWEREALHLTDRPAHFYNELIGTSDVSDIINAAAGTDATRIEVLDEGNVRALRSSASVGVAARREYGLGNTIRVTAAHRFTPNMAKFCRKLEEEFNFPVNINLYCSPPGSKALGRHYDRHSSFVLQICGEKDWLLYTSENSLPLEDVPSMHFEASGDAREYRVRRKQHQVSAHHDSHLSLRLRAGDLLYLPRGLFHQAVAGDAGSIHLTVGIQVITVLDVLSVALADLAHKQPKLRSSLEPGFLRLGGFSEGTQEQFRDLLVAMGHSIDLSATYIDIATSLQRRYARLQGFRIASPNWDSSINAETLLARRTETLVSHHITPDSLRLGVADRIVEIERSALDEIEYIYGVRSFQVRQLPGDRPLEEKIALMQALHAEGIIVKLPPDDDDTLPSS